MFIKYLKFSSPWKMISWNQIYKEALKEGLYYLALTDDDLRRKALVAGMYQVARKREAAGHPQLLRKLEAYQQQTKDSAELGALLEGDNRMGLEFLLEGELPAPETSYIGIRPRRADEPIV